MEPIVLEIAARIVPRSYDRDDRAPYAAAVEAFIRDHVVIADEPFERFHYPEFLLAKIGELGYFVGDCDDVAGLAAALLTVLGIPSRLVAIKRPDDPFFRHVYVEYETAPAGEWASIDPTLTALPDGAFDRMEEIIL